MGRTLPDSDPFRTEPRCFLWFNFQVQFQRGLTSVQSCWFSPDAPWVFPQGHPGDGDCALQGARLCPPGGASGRLRGTFRRSWEVVVSPGVVPGVGPPGPLQECQVIRRRRQAAHPGARPCEAGSRRVHRALGAIGGARPGAHCSAPGTVWSLSSQGSLPTPLVPLRGQTWPLAPGSGLPALAGVLPPGGRDPPGRAQVWKAPGICPIYSGQQADWSVPWGQEVWAPGLG